MRLLGIFLNLFDKDIKKKIRRINEKDGVDALYYDINKINLSRGGSYIDSPEWLKNKKATINPQNEKDDKCFQYALIVALNYK